MDFGIATNMTTWQDFRDLTEQTEIDEFKALFADRTYTYFIRSKNRSDSIDVLDGAEVAARGTDFILIDDPIAGGDEFGTIIILDSAYYSDIRQALYDDDGTIMEGGYTDYQAVKAELEA